MKNKKALQKAVLGCFVFSVAVLTVACSGRTSVSASYDFTTIRRGTLERTVSASGTITPVSTVNVLPRMSGRVERIHVDFNDTVRRGDILAELNTDMLVLRRKQQHASVIKARANYELQSIHFSNQRILAERNLISEYEFRTSRAQLDGLAADLAVAEANLLVVETEINQYAFITSPIDGIVLDRRINIGDTVVDSSSNNSSAIFTLAENLREMQIEALVGELDITSIRRGQAVRFSLESLPGRIFFGEVENIRLVPVVSNNVVSYTVIINIENYDGSLLPGMTCAVDFIVSRAEDVLIVPNAALRYQPTTLSEERIADMVFNASLVALDEEQRQAAIEARARAQSVAGGSNPSGGGLAGLMTGSPPAGRQAAMMMGGGMGRGSAQRGAGQARSPAPVFVMRNLWYINSDGRLAVMQVQAGITNGSFTEIHPTQDIEGMQVILRERVL